MPANIYNGEIAEFDCQIKDTDYAEAYRIYDIRRGRSKGREWKPSIFFAGVIVVLCIFMMVHLSVPDYVFFGIVMLLCIYGCVYYVYWLSNRAAHRGMEIFESSHLLHETIHCHFYRDYYEITNKYEFIRRYYTEITDCIETPELFVLIGGLDNKLTVIAKAELTDEQKNALSKHFSREMIKQYRIKRK